MCHPSVDGFAPHLPLKKPWSEPHDLHRELAVPSSTRIFSLAKVELRTAVALSNPLHTSLQLHSARPGVGGSYRVVYALTRLPAHAVI